MIQLFIASDYPVVRAGLRSILDASRDCQVVGEGSLEEAILRLSTAQPDVVLLELSGGEQEAMEELRRLAAESPEVAVVVLSDDPRESVAREVLQAGVRGYLLRDVSPEEIVDTVRAVHDGLTVLHPATARAILGRSLLQGPAEGVEPLTDRELEVLQLVAQGLPSKTIASRLRISEHTVKFHVGSVLGKLGAASRTEAVTLALRRGLIAL